MSAHVYFEIHASEPQRAMGFYGTLFEWRFEPAQGAPVPYWRIDTGGARGGLLQRPAATPPAECGANAFVCSFETADLDASTERVRNLGGTIALPKFAVPGVCWHGYFLDTEGNTFGLFQPDSGAA